MSDYRMNQAETLALGVGMTSLLDDGVLLTGTPQVTVWEKTGTGEDDWTDRTSDFTVAGQQRNSSEMTDAKGATHAASKAVLFRLTAATDPGTYKLRVECDADDGSHPVSTLELVVSGPGSP